MTEQDVFAALSPEDITGGLGFDEPSLTWDVEPGADTSSLPNKVFGLMLLSLSVMLY